MIDKERIMLSAIWISLMLTYFLGDVLRIFSGDYSAGEIEGMQASQGLYLGVAIILLLPVLMVTLTLVLKQSVNRWANIILAVFLFVFNLIGLPGYSSVFDQFLIIVGLIFNVVTVWYAWRWRNRENVESMA